MNQLEQKIVAYHGTYQGVYILLDNGEKIEARAYASKYNKWIGRTGYFNVLFRKDFSWGIIKDVVFTDEKGE